jgi:hypothetical protein
VKYLAAVVGVLLGGAAGGPIGALTGAAIGYFTGSGVQQVTGQTGVAYQVKRMMEVWHAALQPLARRAEKQP